MHARALSRGFLRLVGIGRRAVVWREIRVARVAAGGRTRVVGWVVNGKHRARALGVRRRPARLEFTEYGLRRLPAGRHRYTLRHRRVLLLRGSAGTAPRPRVSPAPSILGGRMRHSFLSFAAVGVAVALAVAAPAAAAPP